MPSAPATFLLPYPAGSVRSKGKLAMVFLAVGASIFTALVCYAYVTGIATARTRSGWFLLSLLLMLAALQLLLAGILAEVLVRVYYGIRGNDGYVVRREWTRDERSR